MSKRSKNVGSDSTLSNGFVVYVDTKARLKHQTLMQDYQELEKEVDVMRSKLGTGKNRKMVLAAEVGFLRRRYEYLIRMKAMNSSHEVRNETSQHIFPSILEAKPKKKKQYIGKEVAASGRTLRGGKGAMQHSLTLISDLDHKERVDTKKKTLVRSTSPVLDLNKKERLHANDTTLRNTFVPFDLNQDNNSSGKEASFPSQAPIFDLNEISMGDEDYQSNIEAVKFEEGKRSLMRHPHDEAQNDSMLSVCRNAGEGPSRVGKRKISWQDPVALRV